MKIDPKDRPVVLALLAIPFSVLLLFGTLRVLSAPPPQQNEAQAKPQESSGEKISLFDWLQSWGPEHYIALFTLATLGAIGGQLVAMRRTNEHTGVIERAYVKMSHIPPGIDWAEQGSMFDVTIRIQNFGNTPAEVTDVLLKWGIYGARAPLPHTPDYQWPREPDMSGGFLVKDDKFFQRFPFVLTSDQKRHVVDTRGNRLIMFGYVDYRDKFGQRHRAGYARQYDPDIDDRMTYETEDDWKARTNLRIVTQSGYNYDRHREPGEGNDWDT